MRNHPDVDNEGLPAAGSIEEEFARRVTRINGYLIERGIPLTAPELPRQHSDDPWGAPYGSLDRSTLAWCTAVLLLALHHDTPIEMQIPAADAVLRESGVAGLRQLHRDLHGGAPVDYEYIRCPYCSGTMFDPAPVSCQETGCLHYLHGIEHDHYCPVCWGVDYQPEILLPERREYVAKLFAEALLIAGARRRRRWPRSPARTGKTSRRARHRTRPPGDEHAPSTSDTAT
ncbi:hypothetical protein [Streptomyces sp. N35]|uniref:hypothetical protein n=1 Tax=Streptomyces sp. N35 TaxID=2795730 RepID=UPI0018F58D4C|nr:hypothetical protein [Streptomyces sp. N35]